MPEGNKKIQGKAKHLLLWFLSIAGLTLFNIVVILVCQTQSCHADILTQQEKEWLDAHTVIKLGPDPFFPPIEYLDEDGIYRGIAADYITLVERKLGINFNIVRLENWDEVVKQTRNRQIDVWGAATNSKQRSKYMLFTLPHIELPGVIITKQVDQKTLTMEQLKDMKVAVVANYIWQDFIENDYPNMKLVLVPDIQAGLQEVSFNTVDAFVNDLATTSYYIERDGIMNLRVSGETGYYTRLAFASRIDWPELNSILKKGLAQISQTEIKSIFNKWVHLKRESLFDKKEFWITLFTSLGVIALTLICIVVWNKSLRKQIALRTKGLKTELAERERLEEELKISRDMLEFRVKERTAEVAKLSHAVEQSSSTVVITDVKGNIEYVNPHFTQTTGYTREEAMGKNTSILKSGLQKPDFYKEIWCTLLSGNKWQGEFHNKKKSGELYWELATISPIKNKEGVITNFVAIKEDITKQKQLETELLQRADLIKLLQEITLDANEAASLEEAMHICLHRICSFSNWPIGHVYMVGSDGILEPTTIWELRDVKKYHAFQKVTEETTLDICKGLPGRVLADSKAHWIINVTKDDNFSRIKVAADVGLKGAFAFPVLEGESVVAVLEFFSNTAEQPDPFILKIIPLLGTQLGRITERKQAEVKIKEAMKEAIQSNKAKSVFLSSMSHELRTPMNSVLGFAQLLDSDSNETLSKSQKDNVKQILKSGYHLLELINEILDLSGIESGMVRLSSENIEIDTAIIEAITSVEPMTRENSIKINYPTKYIDQYIMADSTRLNQVLMNLLSNAIKYNNVNGSVTISCESPDADTIRINIEDSGPGIAEENHDSMFMPFNRLGVESLNIEGTGVGLSITKKLVEMMGGSIGVESEVGKGSKFYVDFKKVESSVLTTGKKEEVVAEKNNAEITKKYTLIYVEDNPSNLKLVENILQRRLGISLLTASQAQSGIALAHTHNPDMILMDINLPGMDGYEALKLLKNHDQTKEIPVIALSANAMPKDIERGKAAGFRDYITKPIDVNKFLEVVGKVLTNKMPTHPTSRSDWK